MTAAILAQLDAHKNAPAARTPAKRIPGPPAACASPVGLRIAPKEQPGPKATLPLCYATAGPLHAEQFPGEFAVRVTGPLPMLPALMKALDEMVRLAKPTTSATE